MSDLRVCLPGSVTDSAGGVFIRSIDQRVLSLPTKTRPKKIVLHGSDGKSYPFLLKGLEDLHLDERVMQFFETADKYLKEDTSCQKRNLSVKTYSIIPIGDYAAMIEWVEGVSSLFSLYKRWQQGGARLANLPEEQKSVRPSEQFISKLGSAFKARRLSRALPRKKWPSDILASVFRELASETPSNIISNDLWLSSTRPCDWISAVNSFARSTAVVSILGHIIGLGDRHLENILLDRNTGQIVHIDFNVCFDKGFDLRVPEKIPFRLTQNVQGAMGLGGLNGTFRVSCEETLSLLRSNADSILILFECFEYSPLANWKKEVDDERGKVVQDYQIEKALMRLKFGICVWLHTNR